MEKKECLVAAPVFAVLGVISLAVFHITFNALNTTADGNLLKATFMLGVVGSVMLVSGFAFPVLFAVAIMAAGQVLWETLKSVLSVLAVLILYFVEETICEWQAESSRN